MLKIKQRFSIRKLTVGVVSVGMASLCYLAPTVSANEGDAPQPTGDAVTDVAKPAETPTPKEQDTPKKEVQKTTQHILEDTGEVFATEDGEIANKGDNVATNLIKDGKPIVANFVRTEVVDGVTKHFYKEIKTEQDVQKITRHVLGPYKVPYQTENGITEPKKAIFEHEGSNYYYSRTITQGNETIHIYDWVKTGKGVIKHVIKDTGELLGVDEGVDADRDSGMLFNKIEHNGKTYVNDYSELIGNGKEGEFVRTWYMKELKNDQNDVVKDTTISVDDEGNELSKEDGVVAHKDGDVKFNDKTYMFDRTETDETKKITKHVYTRVKTIAKNDKTGEVLDEKDGRFNYPSTDAEFNGVGYSFLYSTLDKGVTTYYYNPQGAEYTFKHYLVDSDGKRELYDEYKTRNIFLPPKYDLIWKNGKSYFYEGVTNDEKNKIKEYEYLERQKVGRHVLKGSVDFNSGPNYQLIGIPETELESRQGIFELNGKYYKFTNELENLNTTNEQRYDYRYFEYEVVTKVTKHVISKGVFSIDENDVGPKQGTFEHDGKTYEFDRTEVNGDVTTHYYKEVVKTARHLISGTNEQIEVTESNIEPKQGEFEFNGKTYVLERTDDTDKNHVIHYYKEVIKETTISVDEEGNELAKENGSITPKTGDVEFNGKLYVFDKTEVDEATKVTKHIYKKVMTKTVDEDGNVLAMEEGIVQHKDGDVEFNGKLYAFDRGEREHGLITLYYNKVITLSVDENGEQLEKEDGRAPHREDPIEFNGKKYKYVSTITEKNVTKHQYKELTKVAKHLISGTDEQIEVTEGNIEPKQGAFEFNGKKYVFDRTDDSDPYNVKHYYKESIERKSKHKIVTSQGSTEISKSQVAEDGQSAEKDGVKYRFLRKVDEKGTDVYYYMQYDNNTPIDELKITRSIDLDGNELEVEAGEKEPKVGVVKFGKKEYTFEKTVIADGITTHYYKAVEFEVPKDAPIEQETYAIITRHVTPDGEEFASEIGSTEYKKTIVSYNGKQYQFDRTEVKGDVVTHYYKLVEEQKPSDAPIVSKDELKVTRSVDMDGNELLVEEGTIDAKQGFVKFKGKEYTFNRTETKDGITTHYYKDGTLLEVRNGTLNIKGGKLTFNGKEYEYVSTEYADGITTHIFKLVFKETTKPTVDVKIPDNVKRPKQIITKRDVQAKKQLPETGDPITISVAGLIGLGLAGVLRKRN